MRADGRLRLLNAERAVKNDLLGRLERWKAGCKTRSVEIQGERGDGVCFWDARLQGKGKQVYVIGLPGLSKTQGIDGSNVEVVIGGEDSADLSHVLRRALDEAEKQGL